jgi:glycosyltransferase involved in cell wall biosynthesis
MKIAIDGRMIFRGNIHGIARYVYELVSCLEKIPSDHEFYILVNKDSPLLDKSWGNNIKLSVLFSSWIGLLEQVEIPFFLKKNNIDLFHSPSFVSPFYTPCLRSMTIHDLNHLAFPEFYTWVHRFYYNFFVWRGVLKSSLIMTMSYFSKSEILKNFSISPRKIFVTHHGVSAHYKPQEDPLCRLSVAKKYGLPDGYIFCLASHKPHKNITHFVQAYFQSKTQLPLVLTEVKDSDMGQWQIPKGKQLIFTQFIQEKDLPTVYSMARLFAYPSLYEGFGLPPLEALACGVRVVAARATSLPEVLKSFAHFFDPYDLNSMAHTIDDALSKGPLMGKEQTLAMEFARSYRWEDMAKETLSLYEKSFLCQPID